MLTQAALSAQRQAKKRNEARIKNQQKYTSTSKPSSYDCYRSGLNRQVVARPPRMIENLPAPEQIQENEDNVDHEFDEHINNKPNNLPVQNELSFDQLCYEDIKKSEKEREEVSQKQIQEKKSLPPTNKNKNNKCCVIY